MSFLDEMLLKTRMENGNVDTDVDTQIDSGFSEFEPLQPTPIVLNFTPKRSVLDDRLDKMKEEEELAKNSITSKTVGKAFLESFNTFRGQISSTYPGAETYISGVINASPGVLREIADQKDVEDSQRVRSSMLPMFEESTSYDELPGKQDGAILRIIADGIERIQKTGPFFDAANQMVKDIHLGKLQHFIPILQIIGLADDVLNKPIEERIEGYRNPKAARFQTEEGQEAIQKLQQFVANKESSLLDPRNFLFSTLGQANNLALGMLGRVPYVGAPIAVVGMGQLEMQDIANRLAAVKGKDGKELIPLDLQERAILNYTTYATAVEYVQNLLYTKSLTPSEMRTQTLKRLGAPMFKRVFKGLSEKALNTLWEAGEEGIQEWMQWYYYEDALNKAEKRTGQDLSKYHVSKEDMLKAVGTGMRMAAYTGGTTETTGVIVQQTQKNKYINKELRKRGLDAALLKEKGVKSSDVMSFLRKSHLEEEQELHEYLMTLPEDELLSRAHKLQGVSTFNLEEEIKGKENKKEILVELILAFDSDLQVSKTNRLVEKIQDSNLDNWTKFVLTLAEGSRLSIKNGLAFRSAMEGIYERQVRNQDNPISFDSWVFNLMTADKQAGTSKLFQLDKTQIPLDIVYDIQLGTFNVNATEEQNLNMRATLSTYFKMLQNKNNTIQDVFDMIEGRLSENKIDKKQADTLKQALLNMSQRYDAESKMFKDGVISTKEIDTSLHVPDVKIGDYYDNETINERILRHKDLFEGDNKNDNLRALLKATSPENRVHAVDSWAKRNPKSLDIIIDILAIQAEINGYALEDLITGQHDNIFGITWDKEGNIIPIHQRFDVNKNNALYQKGEKFRLLSAVFNIETADNLVLSEKVHKQKVPLDQLKQIVAFSKNFIVTNKDKISRAEPEKYPLYFAYVNGSYILIDGHHRAQRALELGIEPEAYVFTEEQTSKIREDSPHLEQNGKSNQQDFPPPQDLKTAIANWFKGNVHRHRDYGKLESLLMPEYVVQYTEQEIQDLLRPMGKEEAARLLPIVIEYQRSIIFSGEGGQGLLFQRETQVSSEEAHAAAMTQRGVPESQMLNTVLGLQKLGGSAVFNDLLEHVGDLAHRAQERDGIGMSGWKEKIRKLHRLTHPDAGWMSLEEEIKTGIRNNIEYIIFNKYPEYETYQKQLANEGKPEYLAWEKLRKERAAEIDELMSSFWERADSLMQKYITAHETKNIPKTQLGYLGRQAAIALAKRDFAELKRVSSEMWNWYNYFAELSKEAETTGTFPKQKYEAARLAPIGATVEDVKQGRFSQLGKEYKSGNREVKGQTSFNTVAGRARAFVEFFSTGDFSTLIHEIGHVVTLNLDKNQIDSLAKTIAKEKNIPWIVTMKYLKLFQQNPNHPLLLNSNGEYIDDFVKIQEYFARQFEQYFKHGAAPNRILRNSFIEFSKQLQEIYEGSEELQREAGNLSLDMQTLFDEMISGNIMPERGQSIPVDIAGHKYQAYMSKPKLAAHKKLLKKIEEGLADIAGIHQAVWDYAELILGKSVTYKTQKGKLVAKPNPQLQKDAELALRISKIRTREEAFKTMDYIHKLLLDNQTQQQKYLVGKIKTVLRSIEWNKLTEEDRAKVSSILEGIDMKQMSEKQRAKLISLREAIRKEISGESGSETVLGLGKKHFNALDRLEERNIYDFTLGELEQVYADLIEQISQLTLKGRLQAAQHIRYFQQKYQELAQAADHLAPKDKYLKTGHGEDQQRRHIGRLMKQITHTEIMLPENVFEALADYDESSPIYQLFEAVSEGGAHTRRMNVMIYDFCQRLARTYDLSTWSPHTRQTGKQGKFPKLKTVKVTHNTIDPITGAKKAIVTYMPVSNSELSAFNKNETEDGTYTVTVGKKTVNVTEETVTVLSTPERLGTDFEFINTTVDGEHIIQPVTRSEKLTLLLYAMNEDAAQHVVNQETGGLIFRNNPTWTHKITEKELRRLLQTASQDEIAVATEILNFYENEIKYRINEVSQQLEFRDIATVVNYFPIITVKPEANANEIINMSSVSTSHRAFYDHFIESQNFLKERQNATNPVYIGDAFEIMTTNLDGVARYLGYAAPLKLAKLAIKHGRLDSKSFRSKVSRSWGPETIDALEKWISDIEDPFYQKHEKVARAVRVISNAQTMALLAWNAGTALFQRGSVFLGINYGISHKNMVKALAMNRVKGRHSVEDLMALHPDFHERYLKGFNMALSDTHKQSRARMNFGIHDSWFKDAMNVRDIKDLRDLVNRGLREEGLMWIYKNDAWALSTLWDGCVLQVKEENPQLTPEQQMDTAMIMMRKIVRKTQPDYLIENLSPIHASKDPFTRLVIAKFNNQRHKLYNETIRSFRMMGRALNLKKAMTLGERAETIVHGYGNIVRSTFIVNFYVALIRQALAELGASDDDKKEEGSFLERTMFGTMQNILSTYPVFGPLATTILAQARGLNTYDWTNIVQDGLSSSSIYAGGALKDFAKGDSEKAMQKAYRAGEIALGYTVGYPIYQIRKDINYLVQIYNKITDKKGYE